MNDEKEAFLPLSASIANKWGGNDHQNKWAEHCYQAVLEGVEYLNKKAGEFDNPGFPREFLTFFADKRKEIYRTLNPLGLNTKEGLELGVFRTALTSYFHTEIHNTKGSRYYDQYKPISIQIPKITRSDDIKKAPTLVKFLETGQNIIHSPSFGMEGDRIRVIHSSFEHVSNILDNKYPELLRSALTCGKDEHEVFSKTVGELAWYLFQAAPFERGSAAISSLLIQTVIKYHYPNKPLKPYRNASMDIDLFALFSSKEEFIEYYQNHIKSIETAQDIAAVKTLSSKQHQQQSLGAGSSISSAQSSNSYQSESAKTTESNQESQADETQRKIKLNHLKSLRKLKKEGGLDDKKLEEYKSLKNEIKLYPEKVASINKSTAPSITFITQSLGGTSQEAVKNKGKEEDDEDTKYDEYLEASDFFNDYGSEEDEEDTASDAKTESEGEADSLLSKRRKTV